MKYLHTLALSKKNHLVVLKDSRVTNVKNGLIRAQQEALPGISFG